MLGYGRYDQPKGTWSDDTSMVLCTMESLCNGYCLEDLGSRFCNWLFQSAWTATGYVFDCGITTFTALEALYTGGKTVRECGCETEDHNGNGSLMRILPAALYFRAYDTVAFLDIIHDISQITHAHPRAKMGCGIYALLIRELLAAGDKIIAYHRVMEIARRYYGRRPAMSAELPSFERVLNCSVGELQENEIASSGYVVDTLEAALWCFLTQGSTKEILLAAVNLGLDTDTTGMVAGGLAGLQYGLSGVPSDWLDALARKTELDAIIDRFTRAALQVRAPT
jgi:ADP-ribosylglycohydrolase